MKGATLLKMSPLNLRRLNLSLLILSSVSIKAAVGSDYQSSLRRLGESQSQLDQSLRQLGVHQSGWGEPVTRDQADGRKKTPLFQVHSDLKEPRLPLGRFIFARVVNRLVVAGEGSPSVVEVLSDQGSLSGMRLVGIARQSSNPSRVSIEFKNLVFRGGRAIPIQATALDESGAYGLSAQVVSQKALSVMGAMASSFVSGLAASQQSQAVNAFGFQQTQTTGRNAVLQGLAQTAADQSKRLIDEATAEKPILIVEPETPVTVLVQEEVRW